MKTIKILAGISAMALAGMWLQSCTNDMEYADGEGQLKIKMLVSNELTRAETDENNLAESLILHIVGDKGVLHKYEGMASIPSDLWLKNGEYTAKAWAGDSVSASFDKKAYFAEQPFSIHQGVNNVVITCKIANVVVSVNPDGVPADLMSDWTMTVSNSRASLDFTAENVADAHGYFMQPWTEEGTRENTLQWTIKGKTLLGTDFVKSGSLVNVKPTHEYTLNLKYNPDANPSDVGGAFITVTVDDRELIIEDEISIEAAPRFGALNFDIDKGVSGSMNTFSDMFITGVCYGEPSSVVVRFSDKTAFGMDYDAYDLVKMEQSAADELENNNIKWSLTPNGDYTQLRLNIPADKLNALKNGSYNVQVEITDGYAPARTRSVTIPIEVSDAKVKVLPIDDSEIRSYSAPVTLSILADDAVNSGIRFRAKGSDAWLTATSSASRAGDRVFRLTNLQPSTTYQVQAFCDGYENRQIQEFTTEAIFQLPNASFEDWSECNDLKAGTPFPGTGSTRTFWDSGNHGSMTMGKAITKASTAIKHSGNTSAELKSQFVGLGSIGKFAAGNLFSGTYDKTNGTKGGLLTVGRPIEKCHPVKLTGWANYRPVAVTHAESGAGLSKGDMDKGRVWVAVISSPFQIDNSINPKKLFEENADYVLAFGDVVWNGNFGPDGGMEQFEVNLNWRNPEYKGQYYIVVMCASSYYGDFFTGGDGSVLYIDDLELVYE